MLLNIFETFLASTSTVLDDCGNNITKKSCDGSSFDYNLVSESIKYLLEIIIFKIAIFVKMKNKYQGA